MFVPDKISGSNQFASMQNNSGGWNQQQAIMPASPIAASTRVETYTSPPPVQMNNDTQVNTNRFTYISDQNNSGGTSNSSY